MVDIRKYKHIIWDWNGTILNDTQIVFDVYSEIAVKEGLVPVSLEQFRTTFTFPTIKTYEILGFNILEENFKRMNSDFHVIYSEKIKNAKLHEGVSDIFEKIKNFNITQAIISARPHTYLEKEVPNYGIEKYFKSINGIASEEGDSKVSLGVSYISKLNFSKESVLFIGDTDHDFEVASAMGIDCVLIANGVQDKSILSKCDTPVLNSLSDLII